MPACTVGVEEEYQLLDAGTLALRPRADKILPAAKARLGERVTAEINLSQVEVSTPVCTTLDAIRHHLTELRHAVAEAAAAHGTAAAATGTHPFSEWLGQVITPGPRYEQLAEDYQQLAREQLVCGCHVHVAVPDLDAAVHVIDHVRPWLAVLRALTANSPYWQGVDTGYASYRWAIFQRWPMTGPPPHLGSAEAYRHLVRTLATTDAVPDASFLYWDVRPSTKFPTVEFRVADVCATVDEAVMLTTLCRSLVRTAQADDGPPDDPAPHELLEAANWRAARYGLSDGLIDVAARTSRPAKDVVAALLTHLRPDLEAHGEWDEVSDAVERVLVHGNGADRQRQVYAETGDLRQVVQSTSLVPSS